MTAIKAAGLVEALSGPGPLTVFAPNDEAFAKLPAGTIETLLSDVSKLRGILTYHVVSGDVKSADAAKMTSGGQQPMVPTLQGSPIKIKMNGILNKTLYVNDAKVVSADIVADNGVIHVIDKVLVPREA